MSAEPIRAGQSIQMIGRELPYWVEPAHVFSRLAHLPGAVLLESQAIGKYSIICAHPFGTIQSTGGLASTDLPFMPPQCSDLPLRYLRKALSECALPYSPDAVFAGGAVGYLGYETRISEEDAPPSAIDDLHLPDCRLGFYGCAAVFDHIKMVVRVNGCVHPLIPDPKPGMAELERYISQAHSEGHEKETSNSAHRDCTPMSCFTKDEYRQTVEKIREYIAAGDVYQVNLSQRFTIPADDDPWEIFLRLRERNPASYATFLNYGGYQILSSSPELFLHLDPSTREVETRPIKGTRPRHPDPDEDSRLREELLTSEKDRAENVMIVDLERNDLGRVCEYGSVSAPEIASVESYPTVHHLVSRVTGRLRADRDAVDLLEASFPGGSITGAPKIRAMEIIRELEPIRRGVYTGSIGYLGFDGSVNLNIAIRTAVVKDNVFHFHTGGGIVADSDAEQEYQETLDKGRAFFEVLQCLNEKGL